MKFTRKKEREGVEIILEKNYARVPAMFRRVY